MSYHPPRKLALRRFLVKFTVFLLKLVEKCRQVIENFDYRRHICSPISDKSPCLVQDVLEITGSEDVILK